MELLPPVREGAVLRGGGSAGGPQGQQGPGDPLPRVERWNPGVESVRAAERLARRDAKLERRRRRQVEEREREVQEEKDREKRRKEVRGGWGWVWVRDGRVQGVGVGWGPGCRGEGGWVRGGRVQGVDECIGY